MHLLGMLRLTFRELWARKVTMGLFIVATLVWVMLTFALNLDIVDGTLAGLRIFGQTAEPTESSVDPETGEVVSALLSLDRIVATVQGVVAGMTYWGALLLGLFATASLLPGLLERGRADLLLSKPVGRVRLLTGHVLGVLLVVTVLAIYLLGMVWLVMSLKSGIWNFQFLLAIGVVVVMFGVMYSVITLIGATAQSTPLALIVAYGLIFASLILMGKDEIAPQIRPPWRQVFVALYHVFPNVGEVTALVAQLAGMDGVASWYPLVSSLAFGAVVFLAAGYLFHRRDF